MLSLTHLKRNAMSDDHFQTDHTDEHWLLHLVDQLSLTRWLSLWIGSNFVSAAFYCVASKYFAAHGIVCTTHDGLETPISFWTALYFSSVTTSTLGYGDYAPVGVSRIVATVQAFLGMIIIGAIISKMLTRHQEQVIADTNLMALSERSASVLTALNSQLVEFQQIIHSREHEDHNEESRRRLLRRWENAELRFNYTLEKIHELLRKRDVGASTKAKVLRALRNTVTEFALASELQELSVDLDHSKSLLLGIVKCPEVRAGMSDEESISEIISCLNESAPGN